MTSWPEVRLSDLVTIKHGYAYKGEFFSDRPPGDILLSPGNFAIGGGFQLGKLRYYSGPEATEFVLTPGDLLVTMTDLSKAGDTLGYPAIVPSDGRRYLHNQRLGKVALKDKRASKSFIYWLLRTKPYRDEVLSSVTGSTVKHTSPKKIGAFTFNLPTPAEQDSICAVMDRLDDKIELNRRMNETMEAMAQAIFFDWFVEFGPVRRKMEGATDPVAIMGGLTPDPARTAELAALFPAALGENGLPEGWTARPIGDQVEIAGGSTPSTADESFWAPAEHRWATPKDLSAMADFALFETGRRISPAGLAKITSGLLPAGTVLLSSRAPIGYLAITQEPVAINQGFIALKPTADLGSAYLYLWCKANMEAIMANANGSTFMEISKKNFRPITSAVPSDHAVVRAFGGITQPFIDRIIAAARENRTLAETRDYLLPRLMSGAVRVEVAG